MATAPARVPSAVAVKSILFPVDFSQSSGAAAVIVRALAERYGSTVHMAHVLHPTEPHDTHAEVWDRQFARARLDAFACEYDLNSLPHTKWIEVGDVSVMLDAMVQQLDVDLMVAGTHGRTGVSKVVVGSVAESLFRSAPCPVMTVGPHVAVRNYRILRSILLAIDFAESSTNALRYACSFAEANESELFVLHAMDEVGLATYGHAEEMLQRTRAKILKWAVESQCGRKGLKPVATFGHVADAICRVAAEHSCDLIVMGARATLHPRGVSHTMGATAYKVICGAPCPVLTAKSWVRG